MMFSTITYLQNKKLYQDYSKHHLDEIRLQVEAWRFFKDPTDYKEVYDGALAELIGDKINQKNELSSILYHAGQNSQMKDPFLNLKPECVEAFSEAKILSEPLVAELHRRVKDLDIITERTDLPANLIKFYRCYRDSEIDIQLELMRKVEDYLEELLILYDSNVLVGDTAVFQPYLDKIVQFYSYQHLTCWSAIIDGCAISEVLTFTTTGHYFCMSMGAMAFTKVAYLKILNEPGVYKEVATQIYYTLYNNTVNNTEHFFRTLRRFGNANPGIVRASWQIAILPSVSNVWTIVMQAQLIFKPAIISPVEEVLALPETPKTMAEQYALDKDGKIYKVLDGTINIIYNVSAFTQKARVAVAAGQGFEIETVKKAVIDFTNFLIESWNKIGKDK